MLVIQAFRKQKQENQKFAIILSYIVTLKLTWAIYVRPMLSLSVPQISIFRCGDRHGEAIHLREARIWSHGP